MPPSSVLSVGARLGPENIDYLRTCYPGDPETFIEGNVPFGLKGWRRIQTFLQERKAKAGIAHPKPCR